jgi:hypothetical protein
VTRTRARRPGYRILFLSLRVGTIDAALGLGWFEGHPTSHQILALVGSVSTPTAAMLGVEVPTTLLRGDPTLPVIVTAVEQLAAAMPGTEVVVVPESHDHGASYGHCRRRTETRKRNGLRAVLRPPVSTADVTCHHQATSTALALDRPPTPVELPPGLQRPRRDRYPLGR